jgi:hypothetical protein
MKSMNSPLRAGLVMLAACLPPAAIAADASPFTAVSIRLFEQPDAPVQPFGRRVYATHFDATLTRMVGVEIDATYAKQKETRLYDIACTLKKPDGSSVPGSRAMSFQVFADETESNSANVQWGVPDEQDWPAGEYLVDCALAGQSIGQAAFTVVLNPADVADTDLRIAGLRFFAVDRELPPKDERSYTEVFETANTRRIGVELEYTHSPIGREIAVPVDCHYYWPDGQVMPPAHMTYQPGPTWPGGYSAANMGWDEAGKWPPGQYLVVCEVAGRPAVVNRFEVR